MGKKAYLVCNIAALNRTSKINQASARTDWPYKNEEGESSVFWTRKKANIIIHKIMSKEQHMHNERLWNIKRA